MVKYDAQKLFLVTKAPIANELKHQKFKNFPGYIFQLIPTLKDLTELKLVSCVFSSLWEENVKQL